MAGGGGTGTYVSNWNEVESSGLAYGASTYIVETEEGRWVGTGKDFSGPTWGVATLVLQGEGAYEGLTAYVQLPPSGGPPNFNAIITNGEPIEVPEPVEPPAE